MSIEYLVSWYLPFLQCMVSYRSTKLFMYGQFIATEVPILLLSFQVEVYRDCVKARSTRCSAAGCVEARRCWV